MRKVLRISGSFLCVGLVLCGVFWAGPAFSQEETGDSREIALTTCSDEEFGVEFLCNPDWQIEVDQKALLIIISEDPAVTMTIAKTYTPVFSLSQLDRDVLKTMGQYAEGFETERMIFADRDAIKIQGFAEDYPEMRLLDYYLINDVDMYSVLFSVSPEEEWDNYQSLINRITESFRFIPAR
jgi:hypothetical protein